MALMYVFRNAYTETVDLLKSAGACSHEQARVFWKGLLDGAGVEWRAVNEVFHLRNGYTPSKSNPEYWENGNIPWFRMEDLRSKGGILNTSIQTVHESGIKGSLFPANSIIMATTATIGEHALVTVDYMSNQRFTNFTLKEGFS